MTLYSGTSGDDVFQGTRDAFYTDPRAPEPETRLPRPFDTWQGGDGNDLFRMSFGTHVVEGGAGYDTLSIFEAGGFFSTIRDDHIFRVERTIDATATTVIDLAAGTATYAGQQVSVMYLTQKVVNGVRQEEFTPEVGYSATDLGSFSISFSGIESVAGLADVRDRMSGSDRVDVVEIFAPGKGYSSTRGSFGETFLEDGFDDFVDGRGGVDVVSYAAEILGVSVDLDRNTATGIPFEFLFRGETLYYNIYTDTIRNVEGAYGSKAADSLAGDGAANWFNGGDGDDTIDGRGGFDIVTYALGEFGTIDGGGASGFTGASNGTAGVEVNLADGTATDDWGDTDSLAGIEGVVGSVNDDDITGSEQRNSLFGGDGRDKIYGEDDVDRVYGDAGNDRLYGGNGRDSVYGGTDNDKLWGDNDDDMMFGDKGNDTLTGGKGDDTLEGGAGNDTLLGSAGEDELIGGGNNDSLSGGGGDDELDGGNGRDTISGGGGNDRLTAGKGNDDYIGGGGKSDALGTIGATSGVKIDLGKGTFTGGGFGTNTIKTVEIIFGTDFNDRILGDSVAERLYGAGGKDVLFGGGDDDRLFGGAGRDKIFGGNGDDLIEGDRDPSSSGSGGGASDILHGDDGNDVINGGDGADRMFGDSGLDRLNGGDGNDVMYGGGGADVFVFSKGSDTIRDFQFGNRFTGLNDVIDVSGGDSIARFRNLEEVGAAMEDRSGNVVITVGGNTLTIQGVTFAQLSEANFDFA